MEWRGTPAAQAFWVLLGAVVLWVALAVPAHAAFPGQNGKIAYACQDPGDWEICSINVDGTAQTQLTNNSDFDYYPAWSPDGRRIAFTRAEVEAGNNHEIWIMNPDGTGQRNLTNDPGRDETPTWSPDGTKIAFRGQRSSGVGLFVMDADGKNQTLVYSGNGDVFDPAWSPDGSKIAFEHMNEVFVTGTDGTNLTQISNLPSSDLAKDPAWSPDGSKIAFTDCVPYSEDLYAGDIAVMNADGSGFEKLTNTPSGEDDAAWSPDGTRIAFLLNPGDATCQFGSDLYTMSPDGTNSMPVVSAAAAPDWQPLPGPQRSDFKNTAKFCKAERAFLGESAFAQKYGTNGNYSNAFGKCASASSG